MLFFKVIYNLNRCITLRIVNSLCQQATYSCRRNPISYAVSSFTKNNSISSPKYVLRTVKNIYIGDSSKMFSKNLSTHTHCQYFKTYHIITPLGLSLSHSFSLLQLTKNRNIMI
jgi:hypothetical protein